MKIYRISSRPNDEQLSAWIRQLVDSKYGGSDQSVEGWCGEIAREIYRYLKSNGENPEIWSTVDWLDKNKHPKIIDNPSSKLWNDIDSQTIGVMGHSMVKWNNKWWDGKGNRRVEEIMSEQSFGIEALGNGTSLMREDLVAK